MRTFERKDMHIIGHLRGVTQYELKTDPNVLICELSDKFYYSRVDDINEYQEKLTERVCGCIGKGYDHTLLGEECEIKR